MRSTIAHRIDMLPLTSTGQTPCVYAGAEILRTRHGAIYVCARWLLTEGIAQPEDRIETYWSGTQSMSGLVGHYAEWIVLENEKRGPILVPYRPFDPDLRHRDARMPPALEIPSAVFGY